MAPPISQRPFPPLGRVDLGGFSADNGVSSLTNDLFLCRAVPLMTLVDAWRSGGNLIVESMP